MGEDISYEEHVAINNQRLTSIRASLSDVQNFSHACVELTKWCSDPRAFTPHFEETLMATLQVAMENGTKEMFDFTLTHDLMSQCFHHRKHLSKASANRINRWYEQLRRMKKNGGKRKRAPPKSANTAATPSTVQNQVGTAASQIPENNNFVEFTPCDGGSTMWGGSAPIAPSGSTAPFHDMGPQHYPVLPYGQMEGNAQMFDQQRMMMARQHHMAQRAAAEGMSNYHGMPGIPPMGVNHVPGQTQPLVRYPPFPPGYNNNQMIRAGHSMLYGQMAPQPHQIHQNPNMARMATPMDKAFVWVPEQQLIEEFSLSVGSHGTDFEINADCFNLLHQTDFYNVMLSTWTPVQSNEYSEFACFINDKQVSFNHMQSKREFVKQYLQSGKNKIQFMYHASQPLHRVTCEFVRKRPFIELRNSMLENGEPVSYKVNNSKMKLAQMAQHQPTGTLTVSLLSHMSKKKMLTPARHRNCRAVACFDLAELLLTNPTITRYFCHFCNVTYKFSDIELDYLIGSLTAQPAMASTTEVIIDRHGNCTRVTPPEPEVKEEKPKRGKKRQTDDTTAIKRIKSESFVKAEPGMQFDPSFSPNIPAPVSLPGHDWTKTQSPYSMQSPTKAALLGPATPATTPSLGCVNPSSNGSSQFNMCSPRQTMMHGMQAPLNHDHNPQPTTSGSGSAPYTPVSVGVNDKNFDVMQIEMNELYKGDGKFCIMDDEGLLRRYLMFTKDCEFEGINIKCLEENHLITSTATSQGGLPPNPIQAGTQFSPHWDEAHLGNK